MNYKKFSVPDNSMFEKDINSNLSYNDLSGSKFLCANTYEGLDIKDDIELEANDKVKNVLSKLN